MPWWIFYNAMLLPLRRKAHYRVKHVKLEFAKRHKHINGIENVFASRSCNYKAKYALRKFDLPNLIAKKENFILHLKQT
ncbi:hypothetical protein [Campylobacter troglodytis]|uniref:hypothetical protein n=1 Tax=Campylobacter troglodytis TaxID=654363 RepID=UPI00115B97F7|nr:hypothetical protein [Campylobacter troglodytis]TQR60840.1 hypothetical protein DMC01_03715 [Campylobacter troglodytis]